MPITFDGRTGAQIGADINAELGASLQLTESGLTLAGNSLTAGQKAQVRAGIGVNSGACLTAFVGDSLTNDVSSAALGPQEYQTHAIEIAAGSIAYAGKYGQQGMGLLTAGTSGKTWAQTLAEIAAASPRPERVVLLIGTNDIGAGVAVASSLVPAYIKAVNDLMALSIDVVTSELPPRTDAASDAALNLRFHTFNTWLNRWSRINGVRCIPMYSACVNKTTGGAWAAGANRDGIHPNKVGARLMGQACADTVGASYIWKPYLAMDNLDATGHLNPLMLTDARTSGGSAETAADGIPDYWGKATSVPATFTHAIEAGSDVVGNWYKQTRDTAAGSPVIRSHKVVAAPGDLIQFACRVKSVIAADGAGLGLSIVGSAGTTWISAGIGTIHTPVGQTIAGQQYAIDTTVYYEGKATAATLAGVYADFSTYIGGGAGGDLYIGQFTLRNLTALGVA